MAPCRRPHRLRISHCPALPSPPVPSQEGKATDRAKRLPKSQELAGLAEFLDKHQAPRVPGSHFHSQVPPITGRCLSFININSITLAPKGAGLRVPGAPLGGPDGL